MCIDHDPYQTQAPEGRKVYMGTCYQTPVTPLGFKRLLDTVFYIPVAPLVLRCDLPKPGGGERCIQYRPEKNETFRRVSDYEITQAMPKKIRRDFDMAVRAYSELVAAGLSQNPCPV